MSSSKKEVVYKPSKEFQKQARIKSLAEYRRLHKHSIDHPDAFWADEASELLWQKKWNQVVKWKPPFVEWFVGGKLNVCENCVDRHAEGDRANKAAIIFEGEPGDQRVITYRQLRREVSRFANVLRANGVRPKQRVIIYMPMIPEAAFAMLACARLGAVHSVVFGGFSADSIRDRCEDSGAAFVITADGGWRRGKIVPLKDNVDAAIKGSKTIKKVIVVRRCENSVKMARGRDVWYHEEVAKVTDQCPARGFDAEHPLFILYTSGSTGKPKGILHTSGGYLTGTHSTFKYVFDIRESDVYWCTADIGWITGHSYIIYGPLAAGATCLMYEGAPNQPDFGRFWKIVEEHGVTIFYTAPTAIRAFMKAGDAFPKKHDLRSLRLLGSVGEPINPAAWEWYYKVIGGGRCPIVDTWWQTETGAIMIAPMPGATPLKPGTATLPCFGVDAVTLDENGIPCRANQEGKLVIRKPWPSMLRTIYGDKKRYVQTYWGENTSIYVAGDGARRDSDGYTWIIGRLDDVLNVSGHRLGTAEVESALVSHPAVVEAAVVGRPDEIKGQGIVAFVILASKAKPGDALAKELRVHVGKVIGPIARPDDIRFAGALPKTRSGKIMRRILKEICAGGEIKGDTSTLEDFQAIADLQGGAKGKK